MPIKNSSIVRKHRLPTAYNMFIKEAMHKIRMANPKVKQKDIMKMAAQMWRTKV